MERENYVTVLTFTYSHEVAIVRGRLESEGINCFVQDELTIQVHPFYSNAIGGVKLQVREQDLEQTIEILKETGYITYEDLRPSKELENLNKLFSKVPIINKLFLKNEA